MDMDPILYVLAFLFLKGKGPAAPSATLPRPDGPPPVDPKLRGELEKLGASPALAAGLARWAAVATNPGETPWLGATMVPDPPPPTPAGRILATFAALWNAAKNLNAGKPLSESDADKLWWAYAGYYKPEMFVASPGGPARAAAQTLGKMDLPAADKVLLSKANWIAFGNKVA